MIYTINFGDGTIGALTQSSCFGMPPWAARAVSNAPAPPLIPTPLPGTDTATLLDASGETLGTVTITVGGSTATPMVGLTATHH
jgi:hypothetical protein